MEPESPTGGLLRVRGLKSGYGGRDVLRGVDIEVSRGEIVAMLGRNGAGKSTLLKAVFRLLRWSQGEVWLRGIDLARLTPADLRRLGVSFVPQGGRVFSELTVLENLEVAGQFLGDKQRLREGVDRAMEFAPVLRELSGKRCYQLSGGERQMVALGSGLISSPQLLLLDEPSLGLSPSATASVFEFLQRVSTTGVGVLMVEQRVRQALQYASRVYVLRNGSVSYSGPCEALMDESFLRQVYL